MGAGKSSVGRCLQKRTGLACFDTDEMVSSKLGLSISEIFAQHGEEHFRDRESDALQELRGAKPAVVVTGGGIVLRKENVDLLRELGTVIWLHANEEILFERASPRGNRPLLQSDRPRETFAELLRKRVPLYEKAADLQLDTSTLTHDQVADVILEKIETPATSR